MTRYDLPAWQLRPGDVIIGIGRWVVTQTQECGIPYGVMVRVDMRPEGAPAAPGLRRSETFDAEQRLTVELGPQRLR